MKYNRSPSPDASLPTPPHSPTGMEVAHPAVSLLQSLEAFYLQERYWAHHTRAALELALTKGIDAPSSSSSSQASLSPASSVASLPSQSGDNVVVKQEQEDVPPPATIPGRSSLWMRRKHAMKLKLDGISTHQHRQRRPSRAPPSEPAARVLEMFSELMDARMESCQRVQRLVQSANRTDLYGMR